MLILINLRTSFSTAIALLNLVVDSLISLHNRYLLDYREIPPWGFDKQSMRPRFIVLLYRTFRYQGMWTMVPSAR